MNNKQFLNKNLIWLLLIFIAIILCYSNSLNGDFQFDDDLTITENERIKNLNNFLHMDWINVYLNAGRPVTNFSFALNYAVGGLDVTGYHVLNLLIHLLVVFLVYLFTRKTLFLAGHEKPEILALIVAGIFGLHPVQSESVSYISQRAESLASLFYLLTLLLFIKAQENRFNVKGIFLYTAGLSAFLAGLGAKEIVITLPAVYLLYDFYFLGKKPLIKRLAVPAPFIIFGLIYLIIRFLSLKESDVAGFAVKETTSFEYLMTQFNVIVTYLRLIVFPVNQNLDYDYAISRYFFEPGTILSFLFLLMIIALAIIYRHKYKVASFGVLWFFLVISPTSSFVPIIDVIFEHRIYLALWGIVTALVLLFYNAYIKVISGRNYFSDNPEIAKKLAAATIIMVMAISGAALYERNKVWQSKLSLWTDVASKSPNKARAHNNLGNCYFIQNDFVSAIPEYKKAIALDRKWYEAYYNLAMSLENTGRSSEAVYYYLVFAREAPPAYDQLKREILNRYRLGG